MTADSKYGLVLIKIKMLFIWQCLTWNMTLAGLISECCCTCRHARQVETVHYATSLVCFFVSSKGRTNSLVHLHIYLLLLFWFSYAPSVISWAVRWASRLTILTTTIDASISLFQMERCRLECDAIASSGFRHPKMDVRSHDLLTHVTAFRLIGVIHRKMVTEQQKNGKTGRDKGKCEYRTKF